MDDLDEMSPAARAEVEEYMGRLVGTIVGNVDRALNGAGLLATVAVNKVGRRFELVITSCLSADDHRLAEDIADAALQSTLIRVSRNGVLH